MSELTPDAAMITAFRVRQPAFSDQVKWPDAVVESALCEGITETNRSRWGVYADVCSNFRQRGIFFFAAHWLALTYLTQDASVPGNINPTARLNQSGRSVADESVQYRITEMQNTGDDWLSTTHYGVQFLRLRRRAGIGAVAV